MLSASDSTNGALNRAVCYRSQNEHKKPPFAPMLSLATSAAAISAILRVCSPKAVHRSFVRVSELLSGDETPKSPKDDTNPETVPNCAAKTRSLLPPPCPLLGALSRLSRERCKLPPLTRIPFKQNLPRISPRFYGVLSKPPSEHGMMHHRTVNNVRKQPKQNGSASGSSNDNSIDDTESSGNDKASRAQNSRLLKQAKRSSEDYKQSHRIAERKRRRELRDVFETLSALLPASQTRDETAKRSKYDVLIDTVSYIDDLELRKTELLSRLNNNY